MNNNSTTHTRTTYTAASLPPLPKITQEILAIYPMVCAEITKLDEKINEKDDTIMQHQENPDEDFQSILALLRLEIEGIRASLWWWLNLQDKIVKRAGLADLIRAHDEGRISSWDFMREVSALHTALAAGTATLL